MNRKIKKKKTKSNIEKKNIARIDLLIRLSGPAH